MSVKVPSKSGVILRWSAIIVAILIVLGLFIVRPQVGNLAEARSELAQVDEQNENLQVEINDLNNKLANIDKIRPDVVALQQRFPDSAQQDQLFAEIQSAARSAGVNIVSLTPAYPTAGGSNVNPNQPQASGNPKAIDTPVDPNAANAAPDQVIGTMPFVVTASGRTSQLQKFASNIMNMKRGVVVNSVAMSSGANGQQISLTANAYLTRKLVDPTTLLTPDQASTNPTPEGQ